MNEHTRGLIIYSAAVLAVIIGAYLLYSQIQREAQDRALLPQVTTSCISGVVNGPSTVAYLHPQIDIAANYVDKTPVDYWMKIVVPNGQNYLVDFTSKSSGGYKLILDGFISGDMRDSYKELFVLTPGEYTLQGWAGEYTEGVPRLGRLVFKTEFTVPDCSKK